MIDAYGWQTTYRIMAGVVLVLCLSGLTYSPNVQSEETESTSVEVKDKGCHIDVSVWKEPEFVATVVSCAVMMFGHYVPQIHLVRYCEDIGITAAQAIATLRLLWARFLRRETGIWSAV
ncbi:hypothetical protein OS493_006122 [Desmophyllum pertusum]|uniref:Uncharacterized protein n=1 Tax=Desmophyllum pertusum TaxID=174260 RepID=A0A9X0A469_9CNID|nr:hypothetical protein OS493_006122 [Desmophyllum pertusum]